MSRPRTSRWIGRRAARRMVAATLAAGLLLGTVAAHVRLIHPSNGNLLRWTSPSSISIVINSAGSADLPDLSHFPALRLAIRAWNEVEGTTMQLVEDTRPAQQARTDWESSSLHMILFDEDNDSGYFPGGTGIVALTPVWFTSGGTITDADILFNGSSFEFTTSGVLNRFDVQDVGAHELGHLLGLDHTGWAGATMYPYVDPVVILHRSLSQDEHGGMRDAYPSGTWSTISGRVRRASDGSAVAGAHVVARNAAGRTFAGTLSDASGNYLLKGLPADTYTVSATPLDQPVSAANLGGGRTIVTNFQSTELATAAVPGSGTTGVGDGNVDADVAIALGRNTDEFPLRANPGETPVFSVRGTNLAIGSTLTAADPSLGITVLSWMNTVVTFGVTVPANATPGHVDLLATSSTGERSLLPAAIEIAAPDPTVGSVAPNTASISGGTALTITGTNFRPGARVILANQIYYDGEGGGCVVVNATTITLTALPSAAGTWDVVVQDATGVEGRAANALTFAAVPTISQVFPTSGWAGGGTVVHVRGSDFVSGMTVHIDGAMQSGVTVIDAGTLRFTSAAGVAGGPYVLEVETPGGQTASSAFTYQSDPDPLITELTPAQGRTSGGQLVTVLGANFTADVEVVFGADAITGTGGTPGTDLVRIDANTLQVLTPPGSAGPTNVLVRALLTEQASVAPAAFSFVSPSGGGGGGCSVAPLDRGPFDGWAGCAPILAAAAWLLLRRQRRPARAACS